MNNTKRIVFLLSIMSFLASCNERVVVINGQKLTAKDSEYGILLFDKFDGGEYHLYDVYQSKHEEDLLLCRFSSKKIRKWYKINSYNRSEERRVGKECRY